MKVEDLLANDSWQRAELAIAERFGFSVIPAEGVLLTLLRDQTQMSDFSVDDVAAVFTDRPERVMEFGVRWYADCHNHDYGEEWDTDEGNQQEANRKVEELGFGEGFLIGYTMLSLYADQKPKLLVEYLRRRRFPHAAKVARDVKRVFASLSDL